MQRKFLFLYNDPEIAEWFDNQPQGSKSRALAQALDIIIANYGTGNLLKAIAKREVLSNSTKELQTSSQSQMISENNNVAEDTKKDDKSFDGDSETSNNTDISSNSNQKGNRKKGPGLDMLSSI